MGSTKTAELQYALVPEPGKVDVYTLVKWINCKEKMSRKEVLEDHILFLSLQLVISSPWRPCHGNAFSPGLISRRPKSNELLLLGE